jgi:glycosyltransferase involved in cell wall biosynthesis
VTTVSILLPTYERACYLPRAIQSALAQTYTDFEVLIGDNSASGETEALVRRFTDPRISYRRHASNLGPQGNWLDLVGRAASPLIATLHDDNTLHPEFLASLVPPMMADDKIAMAFADFEIIDGDDQIDVAATVALTSQTRRDSLAEGRFAPNLSDGLRLVAVWNAPNPSICAVTRRDAVLATEFPSSYEPLYDLWLSYQLVRRNSALYYVRRKLAQFRSHDKSTTGTGYAAPEDRLFEAILAENQGAGAVLEEIRRYWSIIRWGRAKRLMHDSASRSISRQAFTAAAPDLSLTRRLLASIAGTSNVGWTLLRPLLRED